MILNKYIEQKRIEEKRMGGRTYFRSIIVEDQEKLRQSIAKDEEWTTSPKLFLEKSDYSDLKNTNRLMHHFYSTEENIPIELK